ncbi:hypothetical protein Pelo_3961 [Pelomyxa schiedti]|nr:hypothetical protein Pelo_3961 [Pelomyxa schiedti]
MGASESREGAPRRRRVVPAHLALVVCGCRGAGKTTLVQHFMSHSLAPATAADVPPAPASGSGASDVSTGGREERVVVMDDGSRCNVSITCVDYEDLAELAHNFNNYKAFVLVYDATSLKSFNALDALHDQIVHDKGPGTELHLVLVGNKRDLESRREVSTDAGRDLATRWGCEHIEVSATTTSENVFRAAVLASTYEEILYLK